MREIRHFATLCRKIMIMQCQYETICVFFNHFEVDELFCDPMQKDYDNSLSENAFFVEF